MTVTRTCGYLRFDASRGKDNTHMFFYGERTRVEVDPKDPHLREETSPGAPDGKYDQLGDELAGQSLSPSAYLN